MWKFPLTIFIITSIIVFFGAILDKDIKKQFNMSTIVICSITVGAIGGVFALIQELIELLWQFID